MEQYQQFIHKSRYVDGCQGRQKETWEETVQRYGSAEQKAVTRERMLISCYIQLKLCLVCAV